MLPLAPHLAPPKDEAHRTHFDVDVGRRVGGDRLARGGDIEDAQHGDFVAAAHDKMASRAGALPTA